MLCAFVLSPHVHSIEQRKIQSKLTNKISLLTMSSKKSGALKHARIPKDDGEWRKVPVVGDGDKSFASKSEAATYITALVKSGRIKLEVIPAKVRDFFPFLSDLVLQASP